MREHSGVRRERVLDAVRTRGEVRIAELAAELEVSVVTLRRDVEDLARKGQLKRGHGVARSLSPASTEPVPSQRAPHATAVGGTSLPRAGEGTTVGLIVPEHHSYLFGAVSGARAALEAAGVRMAMHIVQHVPGAEHAMARQALAQGASGLLIAPRWRTPDSPALDEEWLAELTVPAVLMERRPAAGSPLHAADAVASDHWYGAHLALDHLISLGHRRIVLAARDDSPTARTLRAAFAQIARERPEVEEWAVVLSSGAAAASAPDPTGAPQAAPLVDLCAVLREHGATAAVLHADVDALMLVQQLRAGGVRVPEDCSVVAYDDVVAALGSPPLTAVSPPTEEIGRAAAELLLRRLEHPRGAAPEAVRRVELLPRLKIRGSAVELVPAAARPTS
ncbi:substrate-binding domain-containing protein [Streptomyces sp. NBC_01795]|uniref:substrate-binding domain-containing protein n=1 Tax=unclassified Streptomyces TaxID=2593676 RepID=UPI002DDA8D1B|nr:MULTISPECIES: substrate-binding domain-containing protein [unclassified Streptomyces]WSA95119.1 substrate-binding domain-containing protein [Streptomyces sp. NBC_01795]WSB79540.1 substrate-binding domain-containing protein [Streptomyces sp. NBC_01775]